MITQAQLLRVYGFTDEKDKAHLCGQSIILSEDGIFFSEGGCEGTSFGICTGYWKQEDTILTFRKIKLENYNAITNIEYYNDPTVEGPVVIVTDIQDKIMWCTLDFGKPGRKNFIVKDSLNNYTDTVHLNEITKYEYFVLRDYYCIYGDRAIFKFPDEKNNVLKVKINFPPYIVLYGKIKQGCSSGVQQYIIHSNYIETMDHKVRYILQNTQ